MTFSNITDIVIPEGNVIRIQDSLGGVLWEKQSAGEIPEWYGASADTDWSQRYMEYVPLGDGTLNLKNTQYSFDGVNWLGGGTINVTKYVPFFVKGDKSYSAISGHTFDFYVRGNIALSFPLKTSFFNFYQNNTHVIGAKYCVIDCYLSWSNYIFQNFFSGCINLKTGPILNATTLQSDHCCLNMFSGCTSLVDPPELRATTLSAYCYNNMFNGCTALTTAPELQADITMGACYKGMFNGCTNLVNTPELHANTMADGCYEQMFNGCSSVNYIKMICINEPSLSAIKDWLNGVSQTGIFVKNINATWLNPTPGINTVPSTWTVIFFDTYENKYYLDTQKSQECDKNGVPV